MTKNIKLIEQETLAKQFEIFKLNDAKFLVPSLNPSETSASTIHKSLRESRMQPISSMDESQSGTNKTDSEKQIELFIQHYQQYGYHSCSERWHNTITEHKRQKFYAGGRQELSGEIFKGLANDSAREFDQADTLRENASQRSLDEEYDVLDEDEGRI